MRLLRRAPLHGLLLAVLVAAGALWPLAAHAQEDGADLPPFPATVSSPLELVAPESLPDAPLAPDAPAPIVINEIHYNHDLDSEWVEFVELHNRAAQAVSLAGWTLSDGVGYTFPAGTVIPARGYLLVAEDPAALRAKYGASALGPYSGRLSGDGDQVVLRDQAAAVVDEVEYGPGFPWPTVGYSPARSIQLMNPAFDNAAAAHWRSAAPTPGAANSVLVGNAPPQVSAVSHAPKQPRQDEAVTVTAEINDSDGMTSVRLLYQVVPPGQYIPLNDPAYQTTWTAIAMQPQGDGTWRVQLPAALSKHRTLVRYRIEATDRGNRRVIVPYADDPQPNFAFLVYQGLPIYPSRLRPDDPLVNFDFTAMRPLPTYIFLGKGDDISNAFFMPPSTWPSGHMGDDYLWRGTLVYNGEVYDHVQYRARGGFARYATGKTTWKVNFNPGHRFQAYDNWGRPYPVKWDKLNLTSTMQQSHRNRRGEQGMFESMTQRLFQLAGVPASNTNWVQLRVIDSPYEISGSQYTGDFWGLYLAVEQIDGFFLERNGLPDGNIYKMENGSGELNNLGRAGPADKSDLNAFQYTYQRLNPSPDWWRATVDLESYFSYRAIVDFAHHYDIDQLKNYIYYRNPETSRWMVLPYDTDLTWYENMPGTGLEPFATPVLGNPDFNIVYQNRLRELRDLLLNPEQIFPLLDEYADVIDTPNGGFSMVDADRYMWDYNPIFGTRYVDPERTAPGTFYASTPQGTFRAMVEEMKRYTERRIAWIDSTLLLDRDYPSTPALAYNGEAGFPVDRLRFAAGDYADPQGPSTFGGMQWRIAEVTNPSAPAYVAGAPRLYEAEALWESGTLTTFARTLTPPPGVVLPGHAYRVRVRFMDNSFRWGHWSAPIEFIAGNPRAPVSTAMQITEIMYNPLPEGNIPEDQLEFVEIANTSNETIALENMRITGGISLIFKPGALLQAGATMLLVRDAASFKTRYGFDASARYDGRLSNGGDTITLLDAFGRTVFSVTYGDDPPWPEGADGAGRSLVYNPLAGDVANPASWRASTALHGSPGEPDPPPVRISEVLLAPAAQRAVELYNPTNGPADVSGWFISDALGDLRKVLLPAGTIVPANGYRVISADVLATASYDGRMVIDAGGYTTLFLASANRQARLTGYRDSLGVPVTEPGVSVGRIRDSLGNEHVVAQAQTTLGAANGAARSGPLAITEVMYRPLAGPEYIELTNLADSPLPLYDAATGEGWLLQGSSFRIPAGLTLPAGGRVLLTALPAHEACALYGERGYTRTLGPLQGALADAQQTIQVLKPVQVAGGTAFAGVDGLTYRAQAPWPVQAATEGQALRRINPAAFGDDPANWAPSAPPPGPGTAAAGPALCSLVAELDPDGMAVRWTLANADGVAGFRLWRNSRPVRDDAVELPVILAAEGAQPQAIAPNVPYTVLDKTAPSGAPVYYFVDAVTAGDDISLGFTAPQETPPAIYLPMVAR